MDFDSFSDVLINQKCQIRKMGQSQIRSPAGLASQSDFALLRTLLCFSLGDPHSPEFELFFRGFEEDQ